MFAKGVVATLAALPLVTAVHNVDLRELYNEMYPVDALKRDAFQLCHESDPTFVRLVQADRENCYNRMPESFALAIGRVRPSMDLAELGMPRVYFAEPTPEPLRRRPAAPDHLALALDTLATGAGATGTAPTCSEAAEAPAPLQVSTSIRVRQHDSLATLLAAAATRAETPLALAALVGKAEAKPLAPAAEANTLSLILDLAAPRPHSCTPA